MNMISIQDHNTIDDNTYKALVYCSLPHKRRHLHLLPK